MKSRAYFDYFLFGLAFLASWFFVARARSAEVLIAEAANPYGHISIAPADITGDATTWGLCLVFSFIGAFFWASRSNAQFWPLVKSGAGGTILAFAVSNIAVDYAADSWLKGYWPVGVVILVCTLLGILGGIISDWLANDANRSRFVAWLAAKAAKRMGADKDIAP